jgi:hypothetical protein
MCESPPFFLAVAGIADHCSSKMLLTPAPENLFVKISDTGNVHKKLGFYTKIVFISPEWVSSTSEIIKKKPGKFGSGDQGCPHLSENIRACCSRP